MLLMTTFQTESNFMEVLLDFKGRIYACMNCAERNFNNREAV